MRRIHQPVIGITIGDPAGIGAEVTAKALAKSSIRSLGTFKIIGDAAVFERHFPDKIKNCTFLNQNFISKKDYHIGEPNRRTAQASLGYLDRAIELLKTNEINALVTAPVCKEAIVGIAKNFQGHTEYLAKAFQVRQYDMMFVAPFMRTIVVTRHIPLNQVSRSITSQKVYESIKLAHDSLKNQFKITRPRIAVCGLNPHAGEGGNMGREDITIIIPAVKRAKKQKINVQGPFSADTLFIPKNSKNFDVIIAMYHDQGLIPIKTLYFTEVVNLTIGLPFIRTSPAHGTAFDIAGKNQAHPSSMIEAINLAAHLTKR